MQIPPGFHDALAAARQRLGGFDGLLSEKEADFLFLLGAVPTAPGAVLEIGSYLGRSTVFLAEATRLAGDERVIAVDPLSSPSVTDPYLKGAASVEPEFRANLERAGVTGRVEFHHMLSQELAGSWDRSLRFLWIDGDHTVEGARSDLNLFGAHLTDGAIVAIHDVLHRQIGPMRVFMEDVLLSDRYGACGLCGSIGWAQRVFDPARALARRAEKLRVWRRLARLLPLAAFKAVAPSRDKKLFKLKRNFVPHGAVDPETWCRSLDAPAAAS